MIMPFGHNPLESWDHLFLLNGESRGTLKFSIQCSVLHADEPDSLNSPSDPPTFNFLQVQGSQFLCEVPLKKFYFRALLDYYTDCHRYSSHHAEHAHLCPICLTTILIGPFQSKVQVNDSVKETRASRRAVYRASLCHALYRAAWIADTLERDSAFIYLCAKCENQRTVQSIPQLLNDFLLRQYALGDHVWAGITR